MFVDLNDDVSIVVKAENILKVLPIPAALLTPDGKILYANELYAACWMLTAENIIHKTLKELSCDSYFLYLRNVEELKKNKTIEPYEYAQYGHYYLVSLRGNFNQNNELVSILVCGSDITSIKQKQDGLKQQNIELKRLSEYDYLTGLMNRRTYDYCYQQYCNALKNNALKNLSLILIDIDDFKKINDEFGHGMGDEVLSHLSRMLFQVNSNNFCRQVYRYGGEEFIILLTESSLFDACNLAEDIRTTIEHLSAILFIQYGIRVSISCGVASSDNIVMGCDFFKYADKAMYHAKENKKNCVYYFYNNEYIKFTRETVFN